MLKLKAARDSGKDHHVIGGPRNAAVNAALELKVRGKFKRIPVSKVATCGPSPAAEVNSKYIAVAFVSSRPSETESITTTRRAPLATRRTSPPVIAPRS